jgi:hypothetical protein
MLAIFDAMKSENAARVKRLGLTASDPHKDRNDMQELMFVRELTEVDMVARMAGIDRSDWSMALEPNSLAFFDGVLSGISNGRSYYLKEDLILEILGHLSQREPAFARYFSAQNVLEEYGHPFGTIVDLELAAKSCRLLTAPGPQVESRRSVGG